VSAVWKFGLRQAFQCQRHFDVSPPLLALDDPRFPGNQARYAAVPPGDLPRAESMEQAARRVRPIWQERIAPAVKAGRRLLVVAHKNTLRVLIKHIGGYSAAEVERLAIRTGKPWIFELDADMQPIRDYVVDGKTAK
jgi:2,3-bisphosphoglycerate-dependent phosphoglycerate mutase